jgi:hypothetical protein
MTRGLVSVNTREGIGTHVRFVSLLKDGSRLHGSPRASAELAHRVQGSGNRSWKSHRNYRKREFERKLGGRRRKQASRPAGLSLTTYLHPPAIGAHLLRSLPSAFLLVIGRSASRGRWFVRSVHGEGMRRDRPELKRS